MTFFCFSEQDNTSRVGSPSHFVNSSEDMDEEPLMEDEDELIVLDSEHVCSPFNISENTEYSFHYRRNLKSNSEQLKFRDVWWLYILENKKKTKTF